MLNGHIQINPVSELKVIAIKKGKGEIEGGVVSSSGAVCLFGGKENPHSPTVSFGRLP
jgi:hypothetical protein